MFGKPQWFQIDRKSRCLLPACWQGWGYHFAWSATAAIPFVLLLSAQRVPESLVWAAVMSACWLRDGQQIRRAGRSAAAVVDADVLYIGDDENTQMATRNFNFRLRD